MAAVLVVDDEFGIAELLEAILADEGHRVLIALNGRHGLDLLTRQPPDLVFLDYMMPALDGAALLREIAADPALRRIPVVIMSGMPESTVARHCSGYDSFLRKPFRVAQIIALAERLLGKRNEPVS
jgi:CheY-like chemotaxis protein